MAIEKNIEINVNSEKAEKNINDVVNALNKINENLDKVGKQGTDAIDKVDKSIKSTEKNTKTLSKAFTGAGLALKAIGVGLVVEAFNILKDLFSQNQKIADIFGTSIKALSIVFNDLFNFITSNAGNVSKFFKDIFENPLQSLKDLGKAIKDNLIERLNSALEVVGFLSDAFVKFIGGDFKGALNSVKEAGKELVDVYTGVDDTAGKLGKLAEKAVAYGKEVLSTAENMQKLENNAKLAVANQQRLVEQYDRQAEKLRQIRDNDLLSIEDRIKANNELGEVLNNQEKAMLALANAQIAQAQNELALNKSIENKVNLTNALANKEGILAQIEGFRSEQLVNLQGLEKERIELSNTRLTAETQLANQQALFDAQRNKDTEKRILLERQALEETKRTELEALQIRINSYKEGTQARLDAEIEFNNRKQEIENQITLKDDELKQLNFDRQKTALETTINNEREAYETRLQALQDYNALVQASDLLTEEEKRKNAVETFERQKLLEQQRLDLVRNTLSNITTALGENSKAGKAFAIAQALINTYQGVTAELATKTATPLGFALKLANIAATLKIGFDNIRKIKSTSPSGGGAGAGGSSAGVGVGSEPTAPTFNIVGNSGINQLSQAINTQPLRAYVVGNDVTTQQALDRNIVQNATIG